MQILQSKSYHFKFSFPKYHMLINATEDHIDACCFNILFVSLEPLMVIIEYVPYGDLLGYLRKSRGQHDTYYNDPGVKPITNLTSKQLISFAWQVADGMSYLTSKKVMGFLLKVRMFCANQKNHSSHSLMKCVTLPLSINRSFIVIWQLETCWLERMSSVR